MVITKLQSWLNKLSLKPSARKRVARDGRQWAMSSERLENRALLSATGGGAVAAEVAHGKAVNAPNVAGTWDVEATGLGDGTAVITQNGAKITGVITVPGFPSFTTSAKFKAKDPTTITDTVKVPTQGTKLKIDVTIDFGESASPTTFTGTVSVKAAGQTVQLTGAKQEMAPLGNAKAAMLPDVSGTWTLSGTSEPINFETDLEISQSGKGGKIVDGAASFDGGSITFSGKLKKNSNELKGKADVEFGEDTYANNKYTITFDDGFDAFEGTVTIKSVGIDVNLDGALDT